MKKTLHDAFRELIRRRKWHMNSLRSGEQAKRDKATFLKGNRVPEERIREYLASGGWVCVQDEMWEENDILPKG